MHKHDGDLHFAGGIHLLVCEAFDHVVPHLIKNVRAGLSSGHARDWVNEEQWETFLY